MSNVTDYGTINTKNIFVSNITGGQNATLAIGLQRSLTLGTSDDGNTTTKTMTYQHTPSVLTFSDPPLIGPILDPVAGSDAATKDYVLSVVGTSVPSPTPTPGSFLRSDGTIWEKVGTDQIILGEPTQNAPSLAGSVLLMTGTNRDSSATGVRSIVIGSDAAITTQGPDCIAIGSTAAQVNQGDNSIALGTTSGASQSADCISIGRLSGNVQGIGSISIGLSSGAGQGTDAISIGNSSGGPLQGNDAIAIGRDTCATLQTANSIAIGVSSGASQGSASIALGSSSGAMQLFNCIAIGTNSGASQSDGSIAIGNQAGTSQNVNCIAIGSRAGQTNQGANAIAIGLNAGNSSQPANSLMFSTSSVRDKPTVTPGVNASNLGYDTTTGEVYHQIVTKYVTDSAPATESNASNITYGGADFMAGVLNRDCAGSNRVDLTPSAVVIVGQMDNFEDFSTYRILIRNTSAGAFSTTISANTGVTIIGGPIIIQQNEVANLKILRTSLTTVSIYVINIGSTGSSSGTLQEAYDVSTSPEILTDVTRGALTIQRGSLLDTDTVLEIQNGAGTNVTTINGEGNLKITDNGKIILGTGDDFNVVHTGTDTTITNTTGNLTIDNQNATGSTIIQLGSDNNNSNVLIKDDSGNNLIIVEGDGQVTINGNADVTSGLDVTGAALTSAAGITNTFGEVLLSGGNLQLNDGIIASFGTSDELQVTHDGTNASITNSTGNLTINNSDPTGKNIEFIFGTNDGSSCLLMKNSSSETIFSMCSMGNAVLKGRIYYSLGPCTVSTASNVTYSTDDFNCGLLDRNSNGAIRNDTVPTAADLVASIPEAYVGLSYNLYFRATGTNTVIINTNTGVTFDPGFGTATFNVQSLRVSLFIISITNITPGLEAYSVYAMGKDRV